MKATQVLALIAQTKFRPFNELDFDSFSGVETENPLIGVSNEFTVILDGDKISLIDDEGEEQQFHLGEDIFA